MTSEKIHPSHTMRAGDLDPYRLVCALCGATDLQDDVTQPCRLSDAGMSLRDWFAGQALVGMGTWCPGNPTGSLRPKTQAGYAYAVADAMLTARKEGQGGGAC